MPTETEKRLAKKDDERTMHTARDLRKMFYDAIVSYGLIDSVSDFDDLSDSLSLAIKHWLMDMQHEKRMARDLEAQKVIQDLIDRIK